MAKVFAKCPNCNSQIKIDDKEEAEICPNCQRAFIVERAVSLYKSDGNASQKKKRHILRSLGYGLLCALECIGYLFYVIFFLWLFFDIFDNKKK